MSPTGTSDISRPNKRSLDLLDALRQLVHALALVVGMHVGVFGPKMSPLEAVDRTKVSFLALCQSQPDEDDFKRCGKEEKILILTGYMCGESDVCNVYVSTITRSTNQQMRALCRQKTGNSRG